MQLQPFKFLIVFTSTGDQTFTLIIFFSRKSTGSHFNLLPAHCAPAPFTILATVAVVLIPVLFGLAIVVAALHQNQQKQTFLFQNLKEALARKLVVNYYKLYSYLMYFVTDWLCISKFTSITYQRTSHFVG
jgi:hypothetical protein